AVFAITQWRASSNRKSRESINKEFLEAVESAESGDSIQFVSFAKNHGDEPLAGVALYRAASLQYADDDFATAASTFAQAAAVLGEEDPPLPLAGRATLGQGIALIKDDDAKQGKAVLAQLIQNEKFLSSVRGEAWFHLGIQALTENDVSAYQEVETALAEGDDFKTWLEYLRNRKTARDFIAKARSRRKVPLAEKNLEAGKKFLVENKKREGVVTLESGLQYEVLTEGNGTSPAADDEVQVHYHGTLIDGDVFDSSLDRGEPSGFNLGKVVAGWTEGIPMMKEGGKRKFFIPPELAYKEAGRGNIGPNETLVFEVELLKVVPKPEPPAPSVDTNATVVAPPIFIPLEGNGSIVVPPSPENNGSK
ncbi:MAG: FKBP-type peptidyl-prolyl cis-trans isomerase, partial [Opitutales bacterium]